MRLRSLAVSMAAVVAWSCGSSGKGDAVPELPAEDLTATYTGWWIGSQVGSASGTARPSETVGIEITRESANHLRLGDTCPDGSATPALVTGAATLVIPSYTCPVAALGGCPSVAITWSGGSATLDAGVLSLQLAGRVAGCGQAFDVTVQFDGLRDAPPPAVASFAPAWAAMGDPGLTLVVAGSGFAPRAVVRLDGTALPTAFVSATELRATLAKRDLELARAATITVVNVDAQVSLPATFEVRNPAPAPLAVAPDSIAAGTAGATVAINGSGFVPTSVASCDGTRRMTTYVAPTRIQVALGAEDLAVGRDASITVTNPGPGGGTSGPVVLHVLNPVPAPTGVSPASLPLGGPRSFATVSGAGFAAGATVTWNGSPRRTLVASPNLLSVEILPGDLSQAGTAELAVVNSPPGGGSAVAGSLAIEAPPAAASRSVAYQIDPAHSGHARSGGTLAFPAQKAWSVALPDAASYPLVAGGKVFLLVRASASGGYGARLYALDLATGTTSWGPVAIAGTYFWSAHAYEDGKLFVVSGDGRLSSFDAATGAPGWSVSLPGQYAFSAAPSAEGGTVYVGGAGVGGTLYAVDAATGNVRWTRQVSNGDQSSPAVAPDAVYVSYPCQVYKVDRPTGGILWHHSTGCSGGGGKTAAYADGELFVRDVSNGAAAPGAVHDAFDGTVTGSFGSGWSTPPIPAVAGGTRFQLFSGVLERWGRGATAAAWSFRGDGVLTSAPIVVDDAVIVGSSAGRVYAIDAATGLERWSDTVGSAVPAPDEHNVSQPLTGLGFGEGHLVVPAGSTVSAWRVVAP